MFFVRYDNGYDKSNDKCINLNDWYSKLNGVSENELIMLQIDFTQ